jgi:uncharacterized protein (TIGR02246 family)
MKIASTLARLMLLTTLAAPVGCTGMMARATVQSQVAVFNKHDTDALVGNYGKDVDFTTADGVHLKGRESVRAYFTALFATTPDVHMELVDQRTTSSADGYRTHATFKVTSRDQTVSLTVDTQSRSEDGKIVAYGVVNTIDGLVPGSPVAMTLEHAAAAASIVSTSSASAAGAKAGDAPAPPTGDLLDALNASTHKAPSATPALTPPPAPAAQQAAAPAPAGMFVLPQ